MKFGYTIFYVADVEKTVAFYELAFGLKRNFVHESGYGELVTGETKLAFASLELARSNGVEFAPAGVSAPAPAVEIGFTTDDVAAAYQQAIAAGAIAVVEPKQKPWGQTVGYVRDNNGFLVELCSPILSAPPPFVIRPIVPADTPALLELSRGLGFGSDELQTLQRTFDDYPANNARSGCQAITYDESGSLVAVSYFVPMEMTDRTWELVMIVVNADRQEQGIGTRILHATEDAARAAQGRMLVIETSTSPAQDRARRFYRKHGYAEVAQIPDAFADGEGKVIFTKRL